ncbi:MAG: hypothetical protein K9L65_18220, partial [Chromatiaceae bacterium]|nr:hypothetical protein [Chromatiaceae bacterium]
DWRPIGVLIRLRQLDAEAPEWLIAGLFRSSIDLASIQLWTLRVDRLFYSCSVDWARRASGGLSSVRRKSL